MIDWVQAAKGGTNGNAKRRKKLRRLVDIDVCG